MTRGGVSGRGWCTGRCGGACLWWPRRSRGTGGRGAGCGRSSCTRCRSCPTCDTPTWCAASPAPPHCPLRLVSTSNPLPSYAPPRPVSPMAVSASPSCVHTARIHKAHTARIRLPAPPCCIASRPAALPSLPRAARGVLVLSCKCAAALARSRPWPGHGTRTRTQGLLPVSGDRPHPAAAGPHERRSRQAEGFGRARSRALAAGEAAHAGQVVHAGEAQTRAQQARVRAREAREGA